MTRLKTTAIAVLLGASGVATAGMYAPPPVPACTAGSVTIPCEQNAWELGIQALYLKVNALDDVTSTTTVTGTAPVVTTTNYSELDPDYGWGFRLGAGYHFGTGNDVNLNWTHFTQDSDQTETADANSTITGAFINDSLASNNGTAIDTVKTSVDDEFDALNFEFGQHVDFGEHVNARFHAGVQYARIDQTIYQQGWDSEDSAIYNDNNIERKFDGIGPRGGLDTSYDFGNGFSLTANAAAEILVGDSDYDSTANETDTDGDIDTSDVVHSTTNSVVPGAEAKLGAEYTHAMAQGDLALQAGYQVADYWDPLATVDDTGLDEDFGFHGIYLGVKWLGNA